MCKYCSIDEDVGASSVYWVDEFFIAKKLFSLNLYGSYDNDHGFHVRLMANDDMPYLIEKDLKFKYCPMCGRKLEELDG